MATRDQTFFKFAADREARSGADTLCLLSGFTYWVLVSTGLLYLLMLWELTIITTSELRRKKHGIQNTQARASAETITVHHSLISEPSCIAVYESRC